MVRCEILLKKVFSSLISVVKRVQTMFSDIHKKRVQLTNVKLKSQNIIYFSLIKWLFNCNHRWWSKWNATNPEEKFSFWLKVGIIDFFVLIKFLLRGYQLVWLHCGSEDSASVKSYPCAGCAYCFRLNTQTCYISMCDFPSALHFLFYFKVVSISLL